MLVFVLSVVSNWQKNDLVSKNQTFTERKNLGNISMYLTSSQKEDIIEPQSLNEA